MSLPKSGPELRSFLASDGYRWYYRRYAPPDTAGRPLSRIVWVHGIRSHGGWYTRSCTELARAGHEVFFLYRCGAGLNTAHRGDAPSFRRLLDDVAEFLFDLRQTRPWLPVTLAGISWGGKLTLALPYRQPGLVDRIALLCPGLFAQVTPTLGARVQIARCRLRDPGRFFQIPLNEPELFTTDPKWQQFVDQDRYGLREATARFLFNSFSLDLYLKRAVKWANMPTLLMLAGKDRVVSNEQIIQFLKSHMTDKQLTLIKYPESAHTLEFETESHPFLQDFQNWLK